MENHDPNDSTPRNDAQGDRTPLEPGEKPFPGTEAPEGPAADVQTAIESTRDHTAPPNGMPQPGDPATTQDLPPEIPGSYQAQSLTAEPESIADETGAPAKDPGPPATKKSRGKPARRKPGRVLSVNSAPSSRANPIQVFTAPVPIRAVNFIEAIHIRNAVQTHVAIGNTKFPGVEITLRDGVVWMEMEDETTCSPVSNVSSFKPL